MNSELTNALKNQLDTFHSYDKPFDTQLDLWLHEAYARILRAGKRTDWSIPYFSPSSASMCPRALYHKVKKHKKDPYKPQPHQRRWTHLGEHVGDMIQYELLLCQKHYERLSGEKPRFEIAKTGISDFPAFEDFIWKQHMVERDGVKFSILGNGDGILLDNKTGNYVGLEVKSKQQSPSKTSLKAMQGPTDSHLQQVIAYAIMYNLDNFIIAYYNTSKKAWHMTDDDYEKTPDIRLFEVNVTDEMKNDMLDYFASIIKMTEANTPPLPDLSKWMFNPYKNAISMSLTENDLVELEKNIVVTAMIEPIYVSNAKRAALEEIKSRREVFSKNGGEVR